MDAGPGRAGPPGRRPVTDRFRPGDWVHVGDDDEPQIGVVCRVFDDGSVQVFFAEGPGLDEYTADSYPPDWVRHSDGVGHGP